MTEEKNYTFEKNEELSSKIEDFDNDGTTPPSNWLTFDKVGDLILGTYSFAEKMDGKFGEVVITHLLNVSFNGEALGERSDEYKVTIKSRHPHSRTLLTGVNEGQRVGFKFEKEVDTGKINKAKNIVVKFFDMDPNFKTYKFVKESFDDKSEDVDPSFD